MPTQFTEYDIEDHIEWMSVIDTYSTESKCCCRMPDHESVEYELEARRRFLAGYRPSLVVPADQSQYNLMGYPPVLFTDTPPEEEDPPPEGEDPPEEEENPSAVAPLKEAFVLYKSATVVYSFEEQTEEVFGDETETRSSTEAMSFTQTPRNSVEELIGNYGYSTASGNGSYIDLLSVTTETTNFTTTASHAGPISAAGEEEFQNLYTEGVVVNTTTYTDSENPNNDYSDTESYEFSVGAGPWYGKNNTVSFGGSTYTHSTDYSEDILGANDQKIGTKTVTASTSLSGVYDINEAIGLLLDPAFDPEKEDWDSIEESDAYTIVEVADRDGDPLADPPVSPDLRVTRAYVRYIRFKLSVPETSTSTYYKVEWDEYFFPDGWDAMIDDPDWEPPNPLPDPPPEPDQIPDPSAPKPQLLKHVVYEWSGSVDVSDPSSRLIHDWHEIHPPAAEGHVRVMNFKTQSYLGARFGARPQYQVSPVSDGRYTPPDDEEADP